MRFLFRLLCQLGKFLLAFLTLIFQNAEMFTLFAFLFPLNPLADTLDVSPQALAVPDIDSYIGLMHTLFTLEDRYGLHIDEADGEICLKVDVRKNKDAAQLHEMLCAWRQAAAMLKAGEITQAEYDRWRYRYPEFDTTQRWAKVPSQALSDMLVEALKDEEK